MTRHTDIQKWSISCFSRWCLSNCCNGIFLGIVFSGVFGVFLGAQTPVFSASLIHVQTPASNRIQIGRHITVVGHVQDIDILMINESRISVRRGGRFSHELVGQYGHNNLRFVGINFKTDHLVTENRELFCLYPFEDIKDHPVTQEIRLFLTYLGVRDWFGESQLSPDLYLTRSELIYFFDRLKTVKKSRPNGSSDLAVFQDVIPSTRFYSAIRQLGHLFPVRGQSNLYFYPEGLVTRAEMADYILRFMAHRPNAKRRSKIAMDIPSQFWASPEINTAISLGLFPAYWGPLGQFYPYRPITRADAITILMRVPLVRQPLSQFYKTTFLLPSLRFSDQASDPPVYAKKVAEKSKGKRIFSDILAFFGTSIKPDRQMTVTESVQSSIQQPKRHFQRYTIQAGDTLPKISKRLTGKSSHWTIIAKFNQIPIQKRRTSSNRTVFSCQIFVGDTIKIPGGAVINRALVYTDSKWSLAPK